MRFVLAAVVGAVVLAGCGGNDTAGASASGVVPADAVAYAEVQTDAESGQWAAVQELLDRFPSKPKLVELFNDAVASENIDYQRDVRPALGDTLAIVVRGTASDPRVTVLTQSPDEAKLRALMAKLTDGQPYAIGDVDGWTALAEKQAVIDQLRAADGSLASEPGFEAARDKLPEEVLGWTFVRGSLLEEATSGFGVPRAASTGFDWFAAAAEARDDGASVHLVASGEIADDAKAYTSERLDQAPADSLAFVSFGTDSFRAQAGALRSYSDLLGIPLDELVADLRGEGALWVRPGAGLPEVTLVLESANPERLVGEVERLLAGVPLEFHVGVVDGQVVATTASSPQAALERRGDGLGSTQDFMDAAKAAGLPDDTVGFVYVNVADTLPLLGLARAAGVEVPQEALEYLRPVQSVVGWGEVDGGVLVSRLFVHIQ